VSLYSEAINFEKLITSLHQAILKAEGFDNICVQHNVTLPCKSGATAQFDVYWKFKQAGITHEVAIECKNYNSKVDVGEVRDFAYKLQSVGNLHGVIVTRVGYRRSAKIEAKMAGINLKKYQFPDEMDWKGRVRTIKMTVHILLLENIRRSFVFDREWYFKQHPKTQQLQISIGASTDEIFFTKEDGMRIKSLHELENELPRGEATAQNLQETIAFAEPTFLHAPEIPVLKINKVEFVYDVTSTEEEITLQGDEIIQGLLIDDDTGESILFYVNDEVRAIQQD
jgi:hypothetical protein